MIDERTKTPQFKPRLNAYDCPFCGKATVTLDTAEGVTPFMIDCEATPGCKGMAQSRFYNVKEEEGLTPTHEWFEPTPEEARRYSDGMKEYFKKGGLAFRPIPPQCAYCHVKGVKFYPYEAGSVLGIGKGGEHFSKPVTLNACRKCFEERGGLIPVEVNKVPRNSACPCGSQKKYKKCCGGR